MNEFQLGIEDYQKNDYAKARWHFEKALLQAENKDQIFHNIELTKTKLHLEDLESNQNVIELTLRTPTFFFMTLGLFFFLVTLFFYVKKKMSSVYASLFFLFFFTGSVTFIKSQYYLAVNLKEQNIYVGSSMAMPKNGKLPAGLKFVVKKKSENEWIFIESPKDFQGWIKNFNIQRL